MVVGAFPVFKLVALGMKQISKPIANFLKVKAKEHPVFRKYVCMPPAQMYHFWETSLKMRLMGLGKPQEVKKLSEQSAADLGAEMLGEMLIFSVGAGCIYLEYRRQANATYSKETSQQQRVEDLTNVVNELKVMVDMQEARLRDLVRIMEERKGGLK